MSVADVEDEIELTLDVEDEVESNASPDKQRPWNTALESERC